ncbi:hypothetical protein [Bradyrhizobium sp. LMG 9283]|uniref:hypothetical protein n=1 Tax=Bradyrhizobium sp. LMG 9283 TaxID=592064 RepID=UPI00388E3222
MMDICGFLGWFAEDWYRNAGPRTEPVDESRDNVIYVDFKAIREAKEGVCERKS